MVGRNGAPLLGVGRGVAGSPRVEQGVARSLGAGRAEPAPQGSGEPESTSWGSGEAAVTSSVIRSILIIGGREFSFFGYPKIGTQHHYFDLRVHKINTRSQFEFKSIKQVRKRNKYS
jgi:hypothetical protein